MEPELDSDQAASVAASEAKAPVKQRRTVKQVLSSLFWGLPAAFKRQWPLAVVWVLILAALVLIWLQHWRRGAFLIGAATLLAAGFRAVLPERMVGLLKVRTRWFDVLLTAVVGAGICVLAVLVPGSYVP